MLLNVTPCAVDTPTPQKPRVQATGLGVDVQRRTGLPPVVLSKAHRSHGGWGGRFTKQWGGLERACVRACVGWAVVVPQQTLELFL